MAYDPVTNSWDLSLRARGIVLLGAGHPIVLCAVDWIGIANEGHDAFRQTLADAAETTRSRVAVHTLHQHDAPDCDFGAEAILEAAAREPLSYEGTFAREVLRRLDIAVRQALPRARPVTELGLGMRRAWENTRRAPITADAVAWSVESVGLPPAKHLSVEQLQTELRNPDATASSTYSAAKLAWLRRCQAGHQIDIACLNVGNARILHLPGELFVEYQLAAKAERPDGFVAVAAYGDYGPGYIGTAIAYEQGGYETSPDASNVAPEVEPVLLGAIGRLLRATR